MKHVFATTLNRECLRLIGAAAFILFRYSAAAEASLIVSEFAVQNGAIVDTGNGILADQSTVYSTTPVPITDSRTDAVGDTISQMSFDYDWAGDTGMFRIDEMHIVRNPDASFLQARTTGYVHFSPSVDSLISLRLQYTYNLPGSFMDGYGTAAVLNDQTNEVFAQFSFGGFSLGPISGSFDQTMTAAIPAGCACSFAFTTRLVTGPTAVPATDNGTVEFSIAPLPEPAAILPLALSVFALRRRAQRFP